MQIKSSSRKLQSLNLSMGYVAELRFDFRTCYHSLHLGFHNLKTFFFLKKKPCSEVGLHQSVSVFRVQSANINTVLWIWFNRISGVYWLGCRPGRVCILPLPWTCLHWAICLYQPTICNIGIIILLYSNEVKLVNYFRHWVKHCKIRNDDVL